MNSVMAPAPASATCAARPRTVASICCYCGTGCGVKIDTDGERVLKVSGDEKADKDAIESAAKELTDKMMPIGAKMYEQAEKDKTASEDKEEMDKKSNKDGAVEGEVVDEK